MSKTIENIEELTPNEIMEMEENEKHIALLTQHFQAKIANSLKRKKSFHINERKKAIAATCERSSLVVSKSGAIHSRQGSTYNLRMPPKRWSHSDELKAYSDYLAEEFEDLEDFYEMCNMEYENSSDYEECYEDSYDDPYEDYYPYDCDYWGCDLGWPCFDDDKEDDDSFVFNIFANVKTAEQEFNFFVTSLSEPMSESECCYYFNRCVNSWLLDKFGCLPTYQVHYECKCCEIDNLYSLESLIQI